MGGFKEKLLKMMGGVFFFLEGGAVRMSSHVG